MRVHRNYDRVPTIPELNLFYFIQKIERDFEDVYELVSHSVMGDYLKAKSTFLVEHRFIFFFTYANCFVHSLFENIFHT